MSKTRSSDTPDQLRPYEFHGVNLVRKDGSKQASGDCPWCGKSGKFSVNVETGLWKCWSCSGDNGKSGGNARVFIRDLWEASERATKDYRSLASNRKLLYPDTLIHWSVVQSILTGDWMVPGYGAKGSVNQLYRYLKVGDRFRLLPTPTMEHQIHGTYDAKKPVVYLCEGPWDAMALWEVLGSCKEVDGGLAPTSNTERSLLATSSVLAVPGCQVFQPGWHSLFAGKTVNIMYDSDHPRKVPSGMTTPAGYAGMLRVIELLRTAKNPPAEIQYLDWGPEGYDPDLPSGYDVRDYLTRSDSLAGRVSALNELLSKLKEVPDEEGATARRPGVSTIDCLECSSYKELIQAWKKALKWTHGLDHALAAMLASVASTKSVGDQLWLKVIGPAACGKSTLCEALSVNHEYVLAKSTIRGFHSGFRMDGGGSEQDHSLLEQVRNKTLVTKDGDTLLQSPNLPQILSEARDVYDRTSRTHYRNAMSKDYDGINMTWLLCGTSSLRAIDSSELGERFLDCVIMEEIDDELEDEILWRVANKADRSLSMEAKGDVSTQNPPELSLAMQLTGGYVSYLRENAIDTMSTIENPEWAMRKCARLGKFTAHMRARPSYRQEESAEREFAARLVSQLIRLGKCLAFVLNKSSVDEEVMARVRRVALDTSRGQTLVMASYLYENEEGTEARGLTVTVGKSEDRVKHMLRFLRQIKVVEYFTPETVKGVKSRPRWRLTERMRKLFEEVYGDTDDE